MSFHVNDRMSNLNKDFHMRQAKSTATSSKVATTDSKILSNPLASKKAKAAAESVLVQKISKRK